MAQISDAQVERILNHLYAYHAALDNILYRDRDTRNDLTDVGQLLVELEALQVPVTVRFPDNYVANTKDVDDADSCPSQGARREVSE